MTARKFADAETPRTASALFCEMIQVNVGMLISSMHLLWNLIPSTWRFPTFKPWFQIFAHFFRLLWSEYPRQFSWDSKLICVLVRNRLPWLDLKTVRVCVLIPLQFMTVTNSIGGWPAGCRSSVLEDPTWISSFRKFGGRSLSDLMGLLTSNLSAHHHLLSYPVIQYASLLVKRHRCSYKESA